MNKERKISRSVQEPDPLALWDTLVGSKPSE